MHTTPLGERQRRRRQSRLEITDVIATVVLPVERLPVVTLRVEERYLLHVVSPFMH